jgi:hypothetical protein
VDIMRALRWIIISGTVIFVLALVAIAASAAWLNTYIHSDAFKAEVESRAGQSLGGVVKIEKVDFDIFNGVKLQGLVTQIDPAHAGGQGALMVQVAGVNCSYSWKELLNRRLKLTSVILDKPQIVLTKQATPPMAPADNSPNSPAAPSPTDSNPPATTAPPSPSPTESPSDAATAAPGPATSLPFQFILDHATINDGSVSVRDASGAPMVDLQGVNVDANTSAYTGGGDVTGTLKIADIALPSNLHVTNFSTPVTYRPAAVQATPFSASAFGGSLAGGYQLGNTGPSVLDLDAKGLDLAQLTAATVSNSSARLSGPLDVQSKWRGVETGEISGEGDAQLTGGKLEGVKILQDAGAILHINELTAPIIITSAKTHFLVQDRQTKFIGLQLNSTIMQLTGDGVIGFDGSLDASLVLLLSSDAMAKLPKEMAGSFVLQPDGSGSIAFHVNGTTSNPQTDLATRLLMQNTQIKSVIDKALNKFFH